MIEALKSETAKHGDKAAVIPVHRLADVREDLENLQTSAVLNNFQQYILRDIYSFSPPENGFEVRSIVIIASPCPTAVEVKFSYEGKQVPLTLVASYLGKDRTPTRVGAYLQAFLNAKGYQARHAPRLPHKRIAVRSGLARYGRNNICYVEGMGSFLNLSLYFSDMPCEEDPWQEVRQMDLCHSCQICLRNCPTAAILPDRFLINNERCLPYFNEAGAEWNFPGWIDPSAHHALYGCLRCQTVCPANRLYLNTVTYPEGFDEEETALILQGKPFESLPEELKRKLEALEMVEYLGALPRNMRALLNAA